MKVSVRQWPFRNTDHPLNYECIDKVMEEGNGSDTKDEEKPAYPRDRELVVSHVEI